MTPWRLLHMLTRKKFDENAARLAKCDQCTSGAVARLSLPKMFVDAVALMRRLAKAMCMRKSRSTVAHCGELERSVWQEFFEKSALQLMLATGSVTAVGKSKIAFTNEIYFDIALADAIYSELVADPAVAASEYADKLKDGSVNDFEFPILIGKIYKVLSGSEANSLRDRVQGWMAYRSFDDKETRECFWRRCRLIVDIYMSVTSKVAMCQFLKDVLISTGLMFAEHEDALEARQFLNETAFGSDKSSVRDAMTVAAVKADKVDFLFNIVDDHKYLEHTYSKSGFTLLHYAAYYASPNVIDEFRKRDILCSDLQVNAGISGSGAFTPMHLAVFSGDGRTVSALMKFEQLLLLKHDATDKSPLWHAIVNHEVDVISAMTSDPHLRIYLWDVIVEERTEACKHGMEDYLDYENYKRAAREAMVGGAAMMFAHDDIIRLIQDFLVDEKMRTLAIPADQWSSEIGDWWTRESPSAGKIRLFGGRYASFELRLFAQPTEASTIRGRIDEITKCEERVISVGSDVAIKAHAEDAVEIAYSQLDEERVLFGFTIIPNDETEAISKTTVRSVTIPCRYLLILKAAVANGGALSMFVPERVADGEVFGVVRRAKIGA
jgi:hypothetical protein